MAGVRTDTVPRQREHPPGGPDHGRHEREHGPEGRTVIEPVVVEKVAARAVREVEGARAARLRAARAKVSGDVVLLRLRITVRYPRSAREVAARVRGHVKERVERTTGKQVHHIDIEIAELVR
ncbi:hypothetical protein [Nocardiopsis tropica]|uniref:Asp23/Gls24 family envelope stress response protein n=1 Tax=Nocardiopsis tropica TaxID=109330 RepID=A0ABU7KTA4_9ACTN|nr:hypothetical protein [Nocardiopsis umidischolae]MEE2052531.1 hypothetical protein [Nocardiopsis umidischolae]